MFRSIHTLGVMALAGATLLAGNVSTAPAQDASDMSYLMNQVSRGLREEARRRRLDNDRRQFDLDYYMRQQTPTAEEQRELHRQQQVLRALSDPPVTEIRSGKTLNDLLVDTQILRARGIRADGAILPSHALQNVNVTPAGSTGETGILKKGRLTWPALLRDSDFEGERREIDRLLAAAVGQVSGGSAEAETIAKLDRAVKGLEDRLSENAREQGERAGWSPAEYIAAKDFLHRTEQAVNLLQQPNADEALALARDLQAGTAAELVAYMSTHGLRFAPATPGDEAAYATTYRALADYDARLQSKAGSQSQMRSTQYSDRRQSVGGARKYVASDPLAGR